MYLPRPVRRRLHERDARIRAQAQRQERARVRRLRDRRRYRYVFVVAYGRSGSTLVQGLLNTLPRTVVAGENNFYVLNLFRSLAAMRAFRDKHKRHSVREPIGAFYRLTRIKRGPFHQAMNDVVTASILGGDKPTDYDVVGFKEVRWYRIQPGETDDFFTAMDAAFPDVRYILNTRSPEQVLKSGFWSKGDKDNAIAAIERTAAIHDYLRQTRPERTLDVPYEDLVDPERVDDRLRLLAEFATGTRPSEELLGNLRARLSVGHGPNPFGGRDTGGPGDATDG